MIKHLIFIYLLILFSGKVFSNQTQLWLKKVQQTIESIQPFRVEFKSQLIGDTGEVDLEEEGEVLVLNPKKIKWIYNHPEYKVFVLETDNYQFYDRENNQLTRGKIPPDNQKMIWQILGDEELIPLFKCDVKKRIVWFKDDQEELDFEIQLGNDLLPHLVRQKDFSGVTVVYQFSHYQKKSPLTPGDMTLKVPENTEKINIE